MWMGKPRCFRKHHNKGRRRDHTHVPYELLDSIDGRVKAEEEAEVQREVDRTRRRQLAAEEFLRHCEAQKAEERERERVVDDAAEELLQEQLEAEQAKVEEAIEDDGGASAALATADHRAAEAAWDAKERESDDPRAREAWAYRAKAKPMVDAVSVNETPADSSEADAKQAELVRKTWAVAHPPLDGTKAGETIVRTEADVADENVEA